MHVRETRSAALSNWLAWALLVAFTLVSVTLAELLDWRDIASLVVFAFAVIKGQIVAVKFMETPRALPMWNVLYRIWILVIGIVLWGGVFLAGHGGA